MMQKDPHLWMGIFFLVGGFVYRLAIFNILFGFVCLFLSASGGAFLSVEVTEAFLSDPAWLHGWNLTLLKSAHNHFNQFGFITILFGLTLSYSRIPRKFHLIQSVGLWLGALAMGPGMIWKSYEMPSRDETLATYAIGLGVSLALLAIVGHIV